MLQNHVGGGANIYYTYDLNKFNPINSISLIFEKRKQTI